MNYAQCGEDENWHSSHYRHIALLKEINTEVEIRYSVIYQNNTLIL